METFHELLKKYIEIYLGQEGYFADDLRRLEFFKTYPTNTSKADIHQKISVIDDADFSRLEAHDAMAGHILKLNIDSRLSKGDLSVVTDIANLSLHGKPQRLLHFASVYCNSHRPDIFPIYSDQYFEFYKRYIQEHKLGINADDLDRYDVFVKALNDLVDRYGLKAKLNYLQMRKFSWMYAEKVLKEMNSSQA